MKRYTCIPKEYLKKLRLTTILGPFLDVFERLLEMQNFIVHNHPLHNKKRLPPQQPWKTRAGGSRGVGVTVTVISSARSVGDSSSCSCSGSCCGSCCSCSCSCGSCGSSATPLGSSSTPLGSSGTPLGSSGTPLSSSGTPLGRSGVLFTPLVPGRGWEKSLISYAWLPFRLIGNYKEHRNIKSYLQINNIHITFHTSILC